MTMQMARAHDLHCAGHTYTGSMGVVCNAQLTTSSRWERRAVAGPEARTHCAARCDAKLARGQREMRTARVLLVEDNPIMCRFVCSALEADDIQVTEAHAGLQALGMWAAGPTDLVLQDVMLPDMDGFELVSRLRHLPGGADVPILALCGLLSDLDEARVSA